MGYFNEAGKVTCYTHVVGDGYICDPIWENRAQCAKFRIAFFVIPVKNAILSVDCSLFCQDRYYSSRDMIE